MTLGDHQPLSRRQARELARDQGDEVAAVLDAIPILDVPALSPAALRPASFAAPAHNPSLNRSSRSRRHHTVQEQGAPSEITAPARPTAASASAAPEPVDSAPVRAAHTLSRRELRALHAREEQARGADELPHEASYPVDAEPVDAEPVDAELVEAELIELEPAKPTADLVEPEQMYAEPIVADPVVADLTGADDVTPRAYTGWTPPIGHWSIDEDAARDEVPPPDQSLDELISRGIGAGGIPTTTNALILPLIPNQGQSVSPISNTGEIMITGSFDLPRSLGSTGAHPNLFDSSEMDHVMDQLDADQLGGDSAPVSASRAVSTHASTRGMLTPPKKQRASLPMVLVVTTAALAVSVLALFVTGYLLGIF
ncbi:hypothetical protein RCH23_001455 [Cryobacterium sp. CAN_C3]|uniref:hypothetical protein n=1 Tax=unclassified Cryobacterium TaxID=2649013 RepID=UPI0018CB11AC|nr:hypothetical protein [Cryobacterium sp. CAN_C3]MEC5154081.1 hypothetical protein [Cryobacterium sp. CAN_C3]